MSTQPESKHTPGPWERYNYIGQSGLTRVRAVTGKDVVGRETYVDVPANEADARLIAAAPELLAVLLELIDTVERVDPGVYRDCIDEAMKVIAKASSDNQSDLGTNTKET